MIWGVISATLPQVKSAATTTPLYRLLEFWEDKTVRIIDEIKKSLEQGQVKEAFESMMDGKPNKLPGVGYAYFTKLFFFLGQAYDTIELKPLIFDKWMANAYCALLSQVNPKQVNECYRSIDYKNKVALPRTGKKLTQTYESYIIDLKNWAEKGMVCPDKLVEFLFGYARNKEKETPRVQLWKIIEEWDKNN